MKGKLPDINPFRALFCDHFSLETGKGLAGELRQTRVQESTLMAVAYAGEAQTVVNEPEGGLT